MLYILYGQDDFSLYQAMKGIKASLGDAEMLAANTVSLEGQHLTLSELRNKCDAAPFLSSHRLVIVDGLLQRFDIKQRKSRVSKDRSGEGLGDWEGLPTYVKQMPPTTVLLLIDGEVREDNPLLEKLSSLAEVKAFPLLRGKDLRTWIQKRVKEEGGAINSQAVSMLAELVGGDLWAMNSEIQKLLLYCRGRAITENDVRQLTSHIQEANIFSLVDAVAEGRTELAQQILHRLYDEGVSPTYILTMIARQFRLIAQAKDLDAGISRLETQDRLGLKSGYSLNKTLSQAKKYSLESVKLVYDKLLATDLGIKTGKYSEKLALELLVSELACLNP